MVTCNKQRRYSPTRKNFSQARFDAIEREERQRRKRNNARYYEHFKQLWEAQHCADATL